MTIGDPNNLVLTINEIKDVQCYGTATGGATVSVSGGTASYTFSWSAGVAVNMPTSSTVTGLPVGIHTVTVTDSKGCQAVATIEIDEPAALTAVIVSSEDVSCSGDSDGSATVVASGGTASYTYQWSNGETTAVAIQLGKGIASVVVSDANGCTAMAVVTIGEPKPLVADAGVVKQVSCSGGSDGVAFVGAIGGTLPFTVAWSNGSTNALATGLSAGYYTVTVTDANGCQATSSVTLTAPDQLLVTAEVLKDASCNQNNGEAKATAAGGTGPYTYQWSHGIQLTTYGSSTITGLTSGSYQVTVRDANGCEAISGVMIKDGGMITAIVDMHTDVSCHGGSNGAISISVSGGTGPGTYIYDWDSSPGGYASADEDIMNIPAGLYEVVIFDGNGCMAVLKNIEITQPDKLVVEEADNIPVSCQGGQDGSATVLATGGTSPYIYDWLAISGASNGPVRNGLSAGIYTIEVTDANECMVSTVITITEPQALTASATVTANVSCFGGSDGKATVTVFGGTQPYTYEWSNGSTDKTVTGLVQGTYSVVVKDANNCMVPSNMVNITQPASAVQVNITSTTSPSCAGNINGSATALASGGVGPPYDYRWSNGQTTATAINLTAGTYIVTATDANKCVASASEC